MGLVGGLGPGGRSLNRSNTCFGMFSRAVGRYGRVGDGVTAFAPPSSPPPRRPVSAAFAAAAAVFGGRPSSAPIAGAMTTGFRPARAA